MLLKQSQNIGFMEYLTKCRIDNACMLIRQADLRFNEIARMTGYTNYISFNRAFQRYTGKTPTEYQAYILMQKDQ